MYSIYKAKRLKKKIKMFKPNVFGCLPSSGLKKKKRKKKKKKDDRPHVHIYPM